MEVTVRRDDGFTLVEVLVAMTIAAVGFLGLAATHVTSVRATVLGRNVSNATSIATQTIENLRRKPYASVVSSSPATVARDGINFTQTTTAVALGTTSQRVTVGVTWRDQFGNHTPGVQLVTVITE